MKRLVPFLVTLFTATLAGFSAPQVNLSTGFVGDRVAEIKTNPNSSVVVEWSGMTDTITSNNQGSIWLTKGLKVGQNKVLVTSNGATNELEVFVPNRRALNWSHTDAVDSVAMFVGTTNFVNRTIARPRSAKGQRLVSLSVLIEFPRWNPDQYHAGQPTNHGDIEFRIRLKDAGGSWRPVNPNGSIRYISFGDDFWKERYEGQLGRVVFEVEVPEEYGNLDEVVRADSINILFKGISRGSSHFPFAYFRDATEQIMVDAAFEAAPPIDPKVEHEVSPVRSGGVQSDPLFNVKFMVDEHPPESYVEYSITDLLNNEVVQSGIMQHRTVLRMDSLTAPFSLRFDAARVDTLTGWKSELVSTLAEINSSDIPVLLPETFTLRQNYPNPFNPSTTIEFQVPETSNVSLVVYNLLGTEVIKLIDNEPYGVGTHHITWNSQNSFGQRSPSGMYFYVIQAGADFKQTKRMILAK